jgi:hypothetical protein
MRLQLITILCLYFLLTKAWGQSLNTQSTDTQNANDPVSEDQSATVDINFLFGYYNQDGNHSAVTGGIGTEELTDHDFRFLINIPLDSVRWLNIDAGFNYYSSASTDNIDTKVSSASSEDLRSKFYFTYTKFQPKSRSSYSLGWGGSVESDYISTSISAAWNSTSKDGNGRLNIGVRAFFDNWVLIIPEELRKPETELPRTDKRRSYSLAITYQQVINTRLQASIAGELIYQSGLLSTPFHRVFFVEQDTAKIEKLPSDRFKVPLSLRLNYFIGDFLVLRSFFRYYRDSFGIDAITASLEPRFKPNPFFTVYPFYRYHFQTKVDYFEPFKQHRLTAKYYTSDYDLSRFESQTFGLGLHWSPLYGIGRFRLFSKKSVTIFRSIDLRYTHYRRSDGLIANLIGFDFGFSKMGK